jgi:hypothetical protein
LPGPNGGLGDGDQRLSTLETVMKNLAITAFALLAGLVTGPAANAATYTAHYDYVGKPALPDSQIDPQLQADTVTCDSIAGVQRTAPSTRYRNCMRQHGWQYRFVTRDRPDTARSADPNFRSNARLQRGHFIDHDSGMDCQNIGGASVCEPPNGTVQYYDPDQGLNCTRSGIVSVCSNF